MKEKVLLNRRVLNVLIERVHEESLPMEISTGQKVKDQGDVLIEVLLEYPDDFEEKCGALFEEIINEMINEGI